MNIRARFGGSALALLALVPGLGAVAAPAAAARSSQWQLASSPDPKAGGIGDSLSAVACPTASRCFAVGDQGNRGLVVSLLRGRWRVEHATVRGGTARLDAISCTSPVFCLTVGSSDSGFQGLRYDGRAWSVATPARVKSGLASLNGVSCASRLRCWAVGQNGSQKFGYVPLIEQYRSGRWSVQPAGAGAGGVLDSVSCTSGSSCWAVGASWANASANTQVPLVEHWNGSSWKSVSAPHDGKASGLQGVSCASRISCYAVGNVAYPPNSLSGQPFIEHYDGRSWSFAARPKHFGAGTSMGGIWCGGGASCVAVGVEIADASGDVAPYILEQGAVGWHQVTVDRPRPAHEPSLAGVACVRLRPADCYAVGSYNPSASAIVATMILHRS